MATKRRRSGSSKIEDLPAVSPPADLETVKRLVTQVLSLVGESPSRNGLLKTADPIAKALKVLTIGYRQNVDHFRNGGLFSSKGVGIILM